MHANPPSTRIMLELGALITSYSVYIGESKNLLILLMFLIIVLRFRSIHKLIFHLNKDKYE